MDAKVFGYDPKVNKFIDRPWLLLGRKHRVLFHDETGPNSAMAAGARVDGLRGAFGGERHRILDKMCSENPQLRQVLEMMASMTPRRKVGGIMLVKSPRGKMQRIYYYKAKYSSPS